MDMLPTWIKLLGWIPWRSLGLLPAKFRGLQGRPKHSGAAWEESQGATGLAPASNMDKTLWVATLKESGAATWDFSFLQRRPRQS